MKVLYTICAVGLLTIGGCSESTDPVADRDRSGVVADRGPHEADPGQLASVQALEFPDGRAVNLGQKLGHSQQVATFRVRNTSSKTVQFREGVSTSCGCTKAAITPTTLPPGDEATLAVELIVSPIAGQQKVYTATLRTDCGSGTYKDLDFQIEVASIATWTVKPQHLRLRLPVDEGSSRTLFVTGAAGKEIRLKECSSDCSEIDFKIPARELSAVEPVPVEVTIGDPDPGEYILRLTSTDSFAPEKTVQLIVEKQTAVRIVPSVVTLPERTTADDVKFDLMLLTTRQVESARMVPAAGFNCDIQGPREFDSETLIFDAEVAVQSEASVDEELGFVIRFADGSEERVKVRIYE